MQINEKPGDATPRPFHSRFSFTTANVFSLTLIRHIPPPRLPTCLRSHSRFSKTTVLLILKFRANTNAPLDSVDFRDKSRSSLSFSAPTSDHHFIFFELHSSGGGRIRQLPDTELS